MRDRVAAICTHYGQAVYDGKSSAVAAAMNIESTWYRQPERPPAGLRPSSPRRVSRRLELCPAGQRVVVGNQDCYRGPCPEGKPGNFFAHALVFRPEELQRHGYNPLALCRSGLFMASDPGDSTTLPTLGDLGNSSPACLDANSLAGRPGEIGIGTILWRLAQARFGRTTCRPVHAELARGSGLRGRAAGLAAAVGSLPDGRLHVRERSTLDSVFPRLAARDRRPPITSWCSAGRMTRSGICTPKTMSPDLSFSISWGTGSANCPRRGPSPPSRPIACNKTNFPGSSSTIVCWSGRH